MEPAWSVPHTGSGCEMAGRNLMAKLKPGSQVKASLRLQVRITVACWGLSDDPNLKRKRSGDRSAHVHQESPLEIGNHRHQHRREHEPAGHHDQRAGNHAAPRLTGSSCGRPAGSRRPRQSRASWGSLPQERRPECNRKRLRRDSSIEESQPFPFQRQLAFRAPASCARQPVQTTSVAQFRAWQCVHFIGVHHPGISSISAWKEGIQNRRSRRLTRIVLGFPQI